MRFGKADERSYWVPGVNNAEVGRWGFVEFTEVRDREGVAEGIGRPSRRDAVEAVPHEHGEAKPEPMSQSSGPQPTRGLGAEGADSPYGSRQNSTASPSPPATLEPATGAPSAYLMADITPRDVSLPGATGLIENQLGRPTIAHLGQILTYLAGAEISTARWIPPHFRDEHLSAVKWLNERTASGFAFFAIRLRALRIGDSPIAPLFEVLAKPNDWERQVKAAVPRATGLTEEGQANGRFWAAYLDAHPEDAPRGVKRINGRNQYLEPVPGVLVGIWCSLGNSGTYVAPARNGDAEELAERLSPHMAVLQDRLGFKQARKGSLFCLKQMPEGHGNEGDWPKLIERLHEDANLYTSMLKTVLEIHKEA